MRKMMSLLAVVLLCMSLVCPVLAAEFVPSISYKDGPELEIAFQGEKERLEENVSICVIVTSIIGAREKTTDIRQESRDLLLEVYDELTEGEMTVPVEPGWVIRDLVTVDNLLTDCIQVETHDHEQQLQQENIVLSVMFDLGIAPDKEVKVLSFREGTWEEVVEVTNNGDGTVTCIMERTGPLAFCVEAAVTEAPAPATGSFNWIWLLVLLIAVAAVVVMVINRRKLTRE